jgi:glycerol kinase
VSVLAIDQGTTSTRALLFPTTTAGGSGRQLLHSARHRQSHPQPGRVEHDPLEILRHIGECLAAAADHDVEAVGIDNQGESCLAWDGETGEPLSPVLVWQDARTEARIAELRAAGAEALAQAQTGLPLDTYFSASKLGWIMAHLPQAGRLLARGRLRLGTTDAYFLDRLTGRFVTDVTTASRTGLMDLRQGAWDADLCALYGVPLDALPAIVPTTGDFGAVRIGDRLVPVTASIVDQQAALYGHGCRVAGDAKITFGTGAFALAVSGETPPPADPGDGLLPTVAWQKNGAPPTFALDGGVHTASAAVEWAQGLGLFAEHGALAGFGQGTMVERGLVFVPALAGLACPHWDKGARGAWLGLELGHDRAALVQAVLEGVALRMAEVIDAMAARLKLAEPLPVDGGMSANPWFMQFLGDALGRPLRVSDEPELTARGTAALAAEAVDTALALPVGGAVIRPRPMPPVVRDRFAAGIAAVRAYARAAGLPPG